MEVMRYNIYLEKPDELISLLPVGDIHWANLLCDRDKFIETVALIRESPTHFTINLGDNFENNAIISRNNLNKHLDEDAIRKGQLALSQEINELLPYLEELCIKTKRFPDGKLMGLHLGNHEDRNLTHIDFKERICKPLEKLVNRNLYLGDMALTIIKFWYNGRVVDTKTLLSSHGTQFSGSKLGSILEQAHQRSMAYEADVTIFGHTHYAGMKKFNVGYIDDIGESPTYHERKRIIGNTGAFVKSHLEGVDAYTDKKWGSLRDKGTITIVFDPYNHDVGGAI